MRRRSRKLLGAVVMIVVVIIYALVAMGLAQSSPLQEASSLVRGLFFVVIGMGWILPIMPLIRWMERRDE